MEPFSEKFFFNFHKINIKKISLQTAALLKLMPPFTDHEYEDIQVELKNSFPYQKSRRLFVLRYIR
jgi:hypothetical protein